MNHFPSVSSLDSSPPAIIDPSGTKCLICSSPARGNHYGVISCRACAAFYRRSLIQRKEYKCRLKEGKCEISLDDRYQCRACRLRKCKKLGMTPENVPSSKFTSDLAAEYLGSDGSFNLTMEPTHKYNNLKKPKIFIDVSPTINRLKTVLASTLPPVLNTGYLELNALEKMRFALWNYRSNRRFGDLKFEKTIVVALPDKKWEDDLVRIATWLQHSDMFRSLSLEEKMKIFKRVWSRWRKFEKYLISVDTFGKKVYEENVIVCSNYNAANISKIKLDYSFISDRPADELDRLFGHQHRRMLAEVAKPLAHLKPTTIEMTFMLCQLTWQRLDAELDTYSPQIGDLFLDEISGNLHDYYAKKNVQNYAWRVQKLMKIVNSVKEIERERQEMMKLCALFDVFKFRLSDEELALC